MTLHQTLVADPAEFTRTGAALYFHSSQETQAMRAATAIVRAAVDQKIAAYMLDFPTFMDELKTFERSAKLDKAKTVDLAALYFVGSEYSGATGFTPINLFSFIKLRQAAGKPTILVSHLTPIEFSTRYHKTLEELLILPMKFDDENVTMTVDRLTKMLKDGATSGK
jgi:hypothetical protein